MKLFKSWREKRIEEIDSSIEKEKLQALNTFVKTVARIDEVAKLKKRIVDVLREEPEWVFGAVDSLFIKSKNHLLAHDIAKELGIELKRTGEDSFHYRGEYNGMNICLYGAEEVFGCKIVPKKVMKEVTEYEVVCPEVARNE